MTKQEIGDILKNARLAAGYTQAQVASILERKPQVVGHWETGYAQPDANTLFELCDIYGISIDEAFGKKNYQEILSPAALKIARAFDELDPLDQQLVESVVRIASKRPKSMHVVPVIGTVDATGEFETKYAALMEQKELNLETTEST